MYARSPGSLVFKFNALTLTRTGSCMKAIAISSLNAGFFISADYKVIWSEFFSVPDTLVKIKHTGSFFGKIRITWEYPGAIMPGFDGIITQPTPDRSTADGGNNAIAYSFAGNISMAQSRKGNVSFTWQLTSKCFDFHYNFRGKNGADGRALDDPEDRPGVHQRTVFAIC